MKKILIILVLFAFSIATFAQVEDNSHQENNENKDIEFIILDMKLGAVLGGYKDNKFVDAKAASKGLKIGEDYSLFGFNVNKKDSNFRLIKQYAEMEEVCPDYVAVKTDSKVDSGIALSSNARWNPTPRIPVSINPRSKVYQRIVRSFLRSKGLTRPIVKLNKILRIDLEGDGIDEIIIHAENRAEKSKFDTKAGDYSFILLRKIVDGKVKNIFLTGEILTKKVEDTIPYNFELSAILDLDADGQMEIVTYGSYYEGAWAEGFQIKDGKAIKILETGCGV